MEELVTEEDFLAGLGGVGESLVTGPEGAVSWMQWHGMVSVPAIEYRLNLLGWYR